MSESATSNLYKAPRTDISRDQGPFRMHFNFPGRNLPGHDDHGYGPLSTVVESFLDPGTLIPMHQHRNEDIISWVPAGVMRHDDREGNELVTDSDHLMVMNAGSGFWHAEETYDEDPPLRMLQIFVRPHSLNLEPNIQHEPIDAPVANEWRHLFGPKESGAPLFVHNEAHLYDIRLDEGATATFPSVDGLDTYFYVFEGSVEVEGTRFEEAESGLATGPEELAVTAETGTTLVAFLLDPDAPVTRQGTIGR